jgi:hypothetical protein
VYVDIKDAGGARPKVEVMAAPLSGWLCCLPLLNASRRGGGLGSSEAIVSANNDLTFCMTTIARTRNSLVITPTLSPQPRNVRWVGACITWALSSFVPEGGEGLKFLSPKSRLAPSAKIMMSFHCTDLAPVISAGNELVASLDQKDVFRGLYFLSRMIKRLCYTRIFPRLHGPSDIFSSAEL